MTAISCIISRDFSFLFAAFIPHTGEKYILNFLETFKIFFSTHGVSCRAFVFWKLFYEKTEEGSLEW